TTAAAAHRAPEPDLAGAPPGNQAGLERARKLRGLTGLLAALDNLPPVRLPLGPPIPWRVGLPLLAALVAAMLVLGRPSASDGRGTRLPAQETYPVQQEAPLFAPSTPPPAPIVVVEPPATTGFDLFDFGLKLAAVLGLAYGSLLLLRRAGLGAAAARGGGAPSGVRLVSSLALAPNRSVHVIRTPSGKSLLVGATPTQVNLIAELGEIEEPLASDGGGFFDVLASRLSS
ncbi:MAG: flagellar biosynthetic protein FliO, partial [Chloroflexota bacterium]|nr:flagellar biosynthetic protein FliO [Chloroflexota bacterium]